MCGICGLAGGADAAVLGQMTDLLAHRGPDDSGLYMDERNALGLGHRRLAILDLSPAGHQPMTNEDGSLVVVFNGEIYNFRELRERLRAHGVPFRSGTDTEVLLKLYEVEGLDSLRLLNGIFAFAIWDRRRDTLVLARDHFGIKPLYFAEHDGRLAFASEVKALFAVPGIEPAMAPEAVDLFFSFLWTPDPVTAFKGIRKLPPGHVAEWRDGRLHVQPYWDVSYPDATTRRPEASLASLATEFRERFGAAVERQLVSDVPLGAFLSAGLDSTAIVYEMQQRAASPVRTFTIAFEPSGTARDLTLDDTRIAARTAHRFGCRHTEILVKPDVAALLPRLVWHMDEPTADPAIVLAYLVNQHARRDVTVLLSGIGGDEVLGGYRKYVAARQALRYQQLPAALRKGLLDPLFRRAPAHPSMPWAGYGRLLRKWGRSASLPPREQFIANATYLSAADRMQLYTPDLQAQLPATTAARYHHESFDRVSHASWLHQMLYVDTKLFMPSLNLTYNDKMSMASGVEVRVPFLDHELVDWVSTSVPESAKLSGSTTKLLLREAYRGRIPDEVLSAPKAGFGAPIGRWLLTDLREMVDDVLHPDQVRRRGLFRPEVVAQWIREQRAGGIERAWNVWQLLTWELWMQAFLDGRPAGRSIT